jgi:uncharacterized membrane protein
MNQKQIGTILIVIGLLFAGFVYYAKYQNDKQIGLYVKQTGSCYLADGTCLHDQSNIGFIIGFALAGVLLAFGIYLLFDRTQRDLAALSVTVSGALKEAKQKENEKGEFNAFLSAFSEDEQKVIKAIRAQDGIMQSTLRFKTGISKSSLSLMLKGLEEKGIISRKESGKTNKVFLRQKF